MYDRQNNGDRIRQQQPRDYVADPKLSFNGSDPDQGFTEDTAKSSVDGHDNDYDDEDYDPPICNDFHDSHMEVHR